MKLLATFTLLIVATTRAHAYIDPGSGTYMLQLAMAGLLGVVFAIKLSWQRLKVATARLFARHDRSAS